jgi:dTDP-glucose pyrophosphorylase
MKEKEKLYAEMEANNTLYFFEHDLAMQCAKLQRNQRGQMEIAEKGNLSDLLN